MNKLVTLLLFLFVFLIVIYINKPSGMQQHYEQKDREYKAKIDSIKAKYRELIKEDSITFAEYSKLLYKYQRLEEDRNAWQRKYNAEKNRNRTFSNAELDSLVGSIR